MADNFLNALEKIQNKYIKKKSYPELYRGYFYGQRERYIKTEKIAMKYITKGDKILDIGGAPAHFSACLKLLGYDLVGVDIKPSKDRMLIKGESLEVLKCDIEKEALPFDNNKFDKILFMETFEHLYKNPIFALREIRRVLKKNGELILTTPNGYSLKRVIHFLSGNGLGEDPFEQFNRLLLLGHYGHIREYSLSELKIFLEKTGFDIKKVYFVYFGHQRFKKNKIVNFVLKIFYKIFYFLRPHIVIISTKKNNI